MNKAWRGIGYTVAVLIAFVPPLVATNAAAEEIRVNGVLSGDDAKCLSELLSAYYAYPGNHSTQIAELSRSAKVGRTALGKRENKAYIFLFENIGWCGSAGCLLIVGERRRDRNCHLLYVSDGTEKAMETLRKRDHGYRRLYTPCEARFDGTQYQQVHEECPNAKVQR